MFYENEGFCYRCGDSRDGRPTADQRGVQAGIGRSFFIFGLLIIGATFAIAQVRENGWPGVEYIKPWYDQIYEMQGKNAMRGDDYMSWAQMAGGGLCGLGVLAMLIARINGRRRKKSR